MLFLRVITQIASVLGILFLVFIVVMLFHTVPRTITLADQFALRQILGIGIQKMEATDYASEIMLIGRIQAAVFRASPKYEPIPKGKTREPSDLLQGRRGYCFDRARTLDKALRFMGFQTRYAALYSTDKTGSAFLSLLQKGGDDVRSHAAVEVLTSRGWLVVDTMHPWLAIDESGDPMGFADMKHGYKPAYPQEPVYDLYQAPYTTVYGLYSRHGYAYPPYDFIPDVNWQELLINFSS